MTEADVVKRVGYLLTLMGTKAGLEGPPYPAIPLISELKHVAQRLRDDCDPNLNLPDWPIGAGKVPELLKTAGEYIAYLGANYENFGRTNVTSIQNGHRGVVQIGSDIWATVPPWGDDVAEIGGDACAYTIDNDQYCEDYPPNYCFNIGGDPTGQSCAAGDCP